MGQEARNGEAEAPKWEARPQTASDVWNRADFGSPGSLCKLAEASPKNCPPLCPSCKKDTPRTVRHPHMTVTHPLRSLGTADSCKRALGSIATDSRTSAPLLLLPLPVSPPLSPRIASAWARFDASYQLPQRACLWGGPRRVRWPCGPPPS
ncbi:hypothetical protein BDN71DRAFT_862688 [Pleurotus eryngii]|uniref:Uncharacterized protein n=1 Tax=Pleurotus eryngii TaxID=5323 RepID=A0A9P6D7D6_PLEER|nr:hypothetical protein BDN71DRAFT_862688 [Pleurotus eryngii]